MSTPPTKLPCKCGRLATLFEGTQDDYHELRIICACGLEGASLWYRKPKDRDRTIWAACDGWMLNNGSGIAQ